MWFLCWHILKIKYQGIYSMLSTQLIRTNSCLLVQLRDINSLWNHHYTKDLLYLLQEYIYKVQYEVKIGLKFKYKYLNEIMIWVSRKLTVDYFNLDKQRFRHRHTHTEKLSFHLWASLVSMHFYILLAKI